MNHAQFIIGVLKCIKEPSKTEVINLIKYLYGDYNIEKTFHGLHILIKLRDESKLWIEEEELPESMYFFLNEGELSFKEFKGKGFPWEERGSTKNNRSQGENRSDKV